jgi:crotonobetainyl-CoA:carnitine CoA-transferase CaiB-like acyl-CoA transferase
MTWPSLLYEVFQKLVTTADAVTHNLRGDVPEKLGLTYEKLKKFNPKIVCVHLTGYGRVGERANWPGYDYLMQAETGYFHLTGEPNSAPARAGLSLIDLMTGGLASLSLLAGVLSAKEDGLGRDIDISLFDVSLYNLNYIGHWFLNEGIETNRLPRSAHASLTPCQTYKTLDGWIYIMCNKEKFWKLLCEKIGRSDLIKDSRFLTFKERLLNREVLTDLLDKVLMSKNTNQWMNIFKKYVPAAPILNVKEALNNPWVTNQNRIERIEINENESFKYISPPIRYSEQPKVILAPSFGANTEEVLKESGYTSNEIELLRQQGIV